MAAPLIHTEPLRRLYRDWASRLNGRRFPARADFSPTSLRYILGDLNLIDVIRDVSGLQFRYRLYGSHLRDRFGVELTGRSIDNLPNLDQARLRRAHFEEVITTGTPIAYRRNHFFADKNAAHDCEVLVLPLASDSTVIDMLMSAFAWDIGGGAP